MHMRSCRYRGTGMLQSSGPQAAAPKKRRPGRGYCVIPEGATSLQEYAPHFHFEAGGPFSAGDNYCVTIVSPEGHHVNKVYTEY
jgi:hypothetical protein